MGASDCKAQLRDQQLFMPEAVEGPVGLELLQVSEAVALVEMEGVPSQQQRQAPVTLDQAVAGKLVALE
jgi:hypothetical protein